MTSEKYGTGDAGTSTRAWVYHSSATIIISLSSLLLAHTLASFLGFGAYTLNASNRWVNAKNFMAADLIGSDHSVNSRQQLSHNRLSLSAWHGSHEFLYKYPVDVQELQFTTNLSDKSGLYVLIYREQLPSLGVFFSASETLKSAVFKISKDGAFSENQPLKILAPRHSPVRISIRISPPETDQKSAEKLSVSVDDHLEEFPIEGNGTERPNGKSIFGFRSLNAHPLWVDEIKVLDSAQNVVLEEDFSHHLFTLELRARLIRIFAFALLVMIVVITLIPRLRSIYREISLSLVTVLLTLSGLLWVLKMIDVNFYSTLYFVPSRLHIGTHAVTKPQLLEFENLRQSVVAASIQALGIDLKRFKRQEGCESVQGIRAGKSCLPRKSIEYEIDDGMNFRRFKVDDLSPLKSELSTISGPVVVFAGSSQTWGAGASSPQAAWTHLVAKKLVAAKFASSSLNISTPGSRINEIAESIDALLGSPSTLNILLLILNFGCNDGHEPEVLRAGLQNLISKYRTRVRKIVIIDEPMNRRIPNAPVSKAISEVGILNNVTVCRPEKALVEFIRLSQGFVWWDNVHFDDFGHRKMAELIDSCISSH